MGTFLLPSSSSRYSILLDRILQKSSFRVFAPFRFDFSNTSLLLSEPRRRRLPLSTNQAAQFSRLEDGGNGVPPTIFTAISEEGRIGEVKRVTKETNVHVKLNLDGSGIADCSTGIPFLDHMLDQLASHGVLDIVVRASGDIHIDDHHTNEDIALAIGTVAKTCLALLQALGDRKGINRFGHFVAPLDEAAVEIILDLSGRPHLSCDLQIPTERVGTYDTQLVEHFFQSLVHTSGMTLHIQQRAGKNSHHIIEATFKAFARALRQAIEHDVRRSGIVPSTKGVLSRA
ncbi:imidazoleglycerol-phosphate dehydratase isoform X1 [Phalaenopsis equestris]|uniref:imidazoleglycerol-phosphate dehydratase isoform X1 n=1 Tax=Phalaenopsis equestris TaxID=78828 RepID=UPI0009E26233|nr:imidazoleglycerol-phosphate dehydratase isoform X1 [Phalaenopsis equestris]XP_020575003.1 imidazoleglycerol-phosphate dehydratase isoform X1 [Phalaenopsis equestris]